MQSGWRQRAAPIIARVLANHFGEDATAVRRALREAYPFGERAHHPYKIWLDEIRRQRLGMAQFARRGRSVVPKVLEGQEQLPFEVE